MIPDAVFTLPKAKAHLRVVHAEEDALITAFLDAAVAACENVTRRAWTERSWSVAVDACDLESCGCAGGSPAVFHALLSPAVAVVVGYDSVVPPGDLPLPATDYRMSSRHGHSFVNVSAWSVAHGDEGVVGRIDWTAKPADDAVPPDVYAAAMLYLGDLYALREAQVVGTIVQQNALAEMLLRPFVVEMHV